MPKGDETMKVTPPREEISVNDLQAALDAVLLLRRLGLVSVAKVREVRAAIHEDCNVHIERWGCCDDIARLVNDVWKQTRPL